MRWLKNTFIGLASLIILIMAMGVTLAFLFNQNEFREALVHVVNRVTDNQLEIKGPLEIDLSLSPSVKVADIYFKTAAADFELSAAEIDLQVDILPLRSNYLIVRRFIIKDSMVTIRQQPDEDEEEEPFEPLDIRTPVIGKLSVENLVINYSKPGETKPLQIKLDSLQKEGKPDREVIAITGAGSIDGTAFKLKSKSGSIASLLTTDQPYPVNVHFEVLQALIHAEGKISNPREAGDLDIALQIKASDLQDIMDLLHVNTPEMGSLEATARLAGTLDAPRLDDLELKLSKDTVAVQLSGTVGNLVAAEDMQLDFSSAITDAELLAWLLPDQVPRFDSFQTSGKLSGSAGALSLSELTVTASDSKGHKLELSGSTRIVDDPWPLRDLNATLAIASPDTKFVRQFTKAVPLMGPLSGTARASMVSDALVLQDIKLTAGSKKTAQIEGQGDIGHIAFTPTVDVSKIDLKLNLAGASARSIGNLININMPDVGPVRASGRFSGSIASSSIKGLHLQAGSPEKLQIEARGDIQLGALDGDKPLAGLGLDVNFQAPSTTYLAAFTGAEVLELGSIKGVAHVGDSNGIPGVTALDITVQKGKDFQLAVNGSVADLLKLDGLDMKLDLSASDLNAIGQLFDQSLPEEGPVRFSGRARGSLEETRLNGRANLGNTTIATDFTASFSGKRPRLAGSITIPELDVHDIGIYPDWQAAMASAPDKKEFEQITSESADLVKDLFSKEPIDFSGLNALDLDLELSINKLSSTAASIADIYGHVILDNGKLDIKPLKYSVDDDAITQDVMINALTKPPTASVLVSADDIDLGKLLAGSGSRPSPVRGILTAKADLKSRGQSPAELAANLGGEINFITENARIDKSAINLLTVDVIGWAITSMLSPKKDVNIECAMMIMQFDKGRGKSDLYIVDTPDMLIKIDARVDLVNETMDIAIVPEHKKRLLLSKQDPMVISGPIANPQYKLVSVKDLAIETGRAAILAPVTISARILGHLTGLIVEPGEPTGSCDKFLK